MKPGGGSAKGAAYEREKCLEISKWVLLEEFDGERIFRRSVLSGGAHTNSKKKGKLQYKEQAGDISACDPRGDKLISLISLELKHRADIDVAQLIYDSAPKSEHVLSWWRDHAALAKAAGKFPLLIARQNRKPDLLLTNGYVARTLLFNTHGNDAKIKTLGIFYEHDCEIFLWQEFLDKVPYVDFLKWIEETKSQIETR